MDVSAVIVAVIGLLGILGGQAVSRIGQRAELRQKELAEKAAEEHVRFEELRSLLAEYRVEHAEAVTERLSLQEENRKLRSDLAAVVMVVRDEAFRTAAQAEWDLPERGEP